MKGYILDIENIRTIPELGYVISKFMEHLKSVEDSHEAVIMLKQAVKDVEFWTEENVLDGMEDTAKVREIMLRQLREAEKDICKYLGVTFH